MKAISVALLGSGLFREGLYRILSENAFTIALSTKRLADIAPDHAASQGEYSVLLVDESIIGSDDEVQRRLQRDLPDVAVVILADTFVFEATVSAFRNGVAGYIIKDISPKSLVESLRLVALGEKVMPSEMARFLSKRSNSGNWSTQPAEMNLSKREIEVLQLLILGAANKVIGRELGICDATVKVHVKAALRKLHVSNRTQAAIWAMQRGLIDYDVAGVRSVALEGDPALQAVA